MVARSRKTDANALNVHGDDGAARARYSLGTLICFAKKVGEVKRGVDPVDFDFELVFVPREGSGIIMEALGAVLDTANASDTSSLDAKFAAK